jgi:hypothetical protein
LLELSDRLGAHRPEPRRLRTRRTGGARHMDRGSRNRSAPRYLRDDRGWPSPRFMPETKPTAYGWPTVKARAAATAMSLNSFFGNLAVATGFGSDLRARSATRTSPGEISRNAVSGTTSGTSPGCRLHAQMDSPNPVSGPPLTISATANTNSGWSNIDSAFLGQGCL